MWSCNSRLALYSLKSSIVFFSLWKNFNVLSYTCISSIWTWEGRSLICFKRHAKLYSSIYFSVFWRYHLHVIKFNLFSFCLGFDKHTHLGIKSHQLPEFPPCTFSQTPLAANDTYFVPFILKRAFHLNSVFPILLLLQ